MTKKKKFDPFGQKPPLFEIGDIVYLRNGYSPQRISEIIPGPRNLYPSGWMIRGVYLSQEHWTVPGVYPFRDEGDFLLVQRKSEPKKEAEPMKFDTRKTYIYTRNKAHTWKFIGFNSKEVPVFENNDSGEICPIHPSFILEIEPYIIETINLNNTGRGSLFFSCVKGAVSYGDLLLLDDDTVVRVIREDVKFSQAVPLKAKLLKPVEIK